MYWKEKFCFLVKYHDKEDRKEGVDYENSQTMREFIQESTMSANLTKPRVQFRNPQKKI